MLLRSILLSISHSVPCKSRSLRQVVRLVTIRHELEKVFLGRGTNAEIQKRLSDLISSRRNRKTFRVADLVNILKFTAKLNLKLDFPFVAAEMKKCSEVMTAKQLSKSFLAMSSIGKPLDGEITQVNDKEYLLLVSALTPKVRSCREKWNANDLSTIFRGLQHMHSHHKEVTQLISELPAHLVRSQQVLDAEKLGDVLFGLQNLSSAHNEVRELLTGLISYVSECSQPLGEHVGNALYGLQNMRSDHDEVLQLVTALVPLIQSTQQRLSAQALAMALYGLRNMSSERDEVLQLVVVLTPHLTACIDTFTPQDVRMALYGLQNLSSSRKEVALLLDVLLPRVRSCLQPLSPEQISDSLSALQNMSSNRKEVLWIVDLLTSHVKTCQQPFHSDKLLSAMYGLQNMSAEHNHVAHLLDALMPHLQSLQQPFSPRSLAMALYGLSSLDHLECKNLVHGLVAVLLEMSVKVRWERRDLPMAVLATNALLQSSLYSDAAWKGDIQTLRRALSEQMRGWQPTLVCKSDIDVVRTAQKLFSEGRFSVDLFLRTMKVKVLPSTWLCGFEAFLVLRVSGAYYGRTVPLTIVNVEVEGVSTDSLRVKRARKIRDECMRREGVQVHRWQEQALNRSKIVQDRLWELVNSIIIQSVTRDPTDI